MSLSETEAIQKVLSCSNLKVYCDYYSITVEDIKQKPQIAVYILNHQSSLEQLISGYSEMETINQDICDEFQRCEQECQRMIHLMDGELGTDEFKN